MEEKIGGKMKVLLYSEGKNLFNKSGVGKALEHQMKALDSVGIEYTLDENDKYDIAHINTIGHKSSKVLKKSKKKNIPVIYHTHTTFEDFRNSFTLSNFIAPVIKRRVSKLYKAADFLISPSKYTKSLIKSYGINKEIKVISNGVDTKKFTKNSKLAEKFKKEYKIEKPLIICVGLPFMRKGIFEFCELAEELPEYEFIWFGAKITSILPAKVRNLINNPPKNVSFPGFVPEETILGAYSAANIFLFMSYEENEGIAVLEALSMECPVLIRDIPVYKDWLIDGEHCMKANNNDEFKGNIANIKNVEKLIENAKNVAKERDLEFVGKQLEGIYKTVLEKVGV